MYSRYRKQREQRTSNNKSRKGIRKRQTQNTEKLNNSKNQNVDKQFEVDKNRAKWDINQITRKTKAKKHVRRMNEFVAKKWNWKGKGKKDQFFGGAKTFGLRINKISLDRELAISIKFFKKVELFGLLSPKNFESWHKRPKIEKEIAISVG